jgi:EKC/KEOPS complex subunit CGI121/TPRKB
MWLYHNDLKQHQPTHSSNATTAMETITLPHLPDSPIQVCLFNDVKNSAFLRQQLLQGNSDFEYAFLDASVLISTSHVLAACFKAISDSLNSRLKTRNVHSEIVFALSPNNNVSFLAVLVFWWYD